MTIRKTIVTLDLETTGLMPERDSIIEIALVRFHGEKEKGRFSTLVNPGIPIPPVITQLTGINNEMVSGAPAFSEILPQISEFTGETPLLGHNINFDLSFLRKYKLFLHHDAVDSFELASALLPRAPRYTLSALCVYLGIPLSATHRALDDVLATHALFRSLCGIAEELPLDILAEIVRLGQEVPWGGGDVLEEILAVRLKVEGAVVEKAGRSFPAFEPGSAPRRRLVLEPKDPCTAIDVESITSALDEGGAFSKAFPAYEKRPQQIQMAAAVGRAFSESTHLMVEAGTGTGKSLAYLLPAMEWALQNGQRVLISTNTINLQDQLINKDIPDMTRVMQKEIRAAVLKGRSNYICKRRLDGLRRRGAQTSEEMRVLSKILIWLLDSETGDRGELNFNNPQERAVWGRLSAEEELCTAESCQLFGGDVCPFMRARRKADAAHLLVVNHALLVADVASENKVLPEYQYLVVDEGHHLESAATDGLSFSFSKAGLERSLLEIGGKQSGLLGALRMLARRKGVDPYAAASVKAGVEETAAAVDMVLRSGKAFFRRLRDFIDGKREGAEGEYLYQMRIVAAVRSQPGWEGVEEDWENLRSAMKDLVRRCTHCSEAVLELEGLDAENSLAPQLATWARRCGQQAEQTHQIVAQPVSLTINWLEVQRDRDDLSLHSAPLHIGPLLEEHIWHKKACVVLTSATLTTAGKFDYLKGRLQADEAATLTVGSPFDYKSSTLVYLASDIPEPADARAYQQSIQKILVELCIATRGRTLVLFTSHAQLRQTAKAITGPLAREGVVVYDQSEGASRHALLESFRSADKAVLLGTRSFWEGVDVPGDALSVLVIVRLPFGVPSDPIIAARSEVFDQPFNEYSLPEAILRFRQGFGRLIRTKQDRGVFIILDRRVLTKAYGRAFLNSLPDCTREQGVMASLAQRAARWLVKG